MTRPALILIHGWGTGSSCWQSVQTCLDQHNFALPIHCYDLPGYGKNPQSLLGFSATAEHMLSFLPSTAILCGWSLGSLVALQAALLAPSRIRGLILVSTTPSFTERDNWPHGKDPELLDVFTQGVEQNPLSALQRFNSLANQGDTEARKIIRQLNQSLKDHPLPDKAVLLLGLAWLRDVDFRHDIDKINVPIHLIHGEKDPLMPLSAAKWLNKKRHCPPNNLSFDIFHGAAHTPFLNDPPRFAARVVNCCHELSN